jgi:hypothetical protein
MIVKLAYDTDWEHEGEYGIAANRPLHPKHDLKKSLLSALKDKKVSIDIEHSDGKSYSKTDVKNLKALIESNTTNQEWPRDSHWSVGMKNQPTHVLKYLKERHGF